MTKKTPPEAGGIGPDGEHCLSAFAMVVVSRPKVFAEMQQVCSRSLCSATKTSFLFPLHPLCTSSGAALLPSAHCGYTRGVSGNMVLGWGPHVPVEA